MNNEIKKNIVADGSTENSQNNRRLWLIDAAYMWNAASSAFQFDYKLLREALEADGKIFQAYYLNYTPDPPTDARNGFHTWLRSAPPKGPRFQVKLYKLKTLHIECPNCQNAFYRRVHKGVDVGIATLALTLLDRYDTLVLSSGDGDLKDTMEFLRNSENKRLELAVFKSDVSTDLQSLSDHAYWLDDMRSLIEKPQTTTGTTVGTQV